MAATCVGAQQEHVDHENDVAQTEPEAGRGVKCDDRVVGGDGRDEEGDVEEVPVAVVDDQRKLAFSGIAGARLGDCAAGGGLPHRPVVGLAVVVAGDSEGPAGTASPAFQRDPRRELSQPDTEVAGAGRAGRADAR